MAHAARDRGALQLGWMSRLVAVLAVIGVFGYDGFAIMSARIKGEDDAQNAAEAASTEWQQTHDISSAYAAAEDYATPRHDTILTTDFSVDPDNTVHLLLRRHASTVVFSRIGPLRKYTTETLHGDDNANPP
jgi:hypothetical protein